MEGGGGEGIVSGVFGLVEGRFRLVSVFLLGRKATDGDERDNKSTNICIHMSLLHA